MVNEQSAWRVHPKGAVFSELDGAGRHGAAPHGLARGRARESAAAACSSSNGRGDFIEKYLETYAHFQAAGWNVTAFDWRGQGGSRGPGRGKSLGQLRHPDRRS